MFKSTPWLAVGLIGLALSNYKPAPQTVMMNMLMSWILPTALLSFSLAAAGQTPTQSGAPPPTPDAAQQRKILDQAAEYAANHENNLPNFICTQTTQRFVDYTGKAGFRPVDLIVERLTYFEHHEDYKVFLVNGVPSNAGHEELGGASHPANLVPS